MPSRVKKYLLGSILTLLIPLYYFMAAYFADFMTEDQEAFREAYFRYTILGDSNISVFICIAMAVISIKFSFWIVYYSDEKRFMALGLVLMLAAILLLMLFTFWLM